MGQGGLRSSTGEERPSPGKRGPRSPAAAHLPGSGHRGAVDLEGAHAAIAAAPCAQAGRGKLGGREGAGGPATAPHVTAGTNGAGGPGHAASAGPGSGPGSPSRPGTAAPRTSGAEQLYFILAIICTDKRVRRRPVYTHGARRGGGERVGRGPHRPCLGCSVRKGPRSCPQAGTGRAGGISI